VSEQEWRHFAQELQRFSRRFPSAPQADEAKIEIARLYLSFATERQNAGRPRSEWEGDLTQGKEVLAALSSKGANDVALLLRQRLEELGAPEAPPEPAAVSPEERKLRQLHLEAQEFYSKGEWDHIPDLIDQMLKIDPADQGAKAWKKEIEKLKKIGVY
jgi:hypothetical protein